MVQTQLARLIARWVDTQVASAAVPPILMISGAQGIGKSTALAAIGGRTASRIAVLGLDDFYLPAAARVSLAQTVHPLCATRGPPGTHDWALLCDCLAQLQHGPAGRPVAIPRFSKPRDDRLLRAEWASVPARPDAIIIEGWLMGVLPDPAAPLQPPINPLEAEADAAGVWRAWQENALVENYAPLWDRADAFLHLRAPSFAIIAAWRSEQEERNLGLAPGTLSPARRAWVTRFVAHYERLTHRMLDGYHRAGDSILLNDARIPQTGRDEKG